VGTEPFYQAPLYPYVLAVCFKVLGEAVTSIRVVQTVWGAAACGLIYFGTSRLFGRGAGMIAGMMLALYTPAIFFDGIVQKSSLTCLLVCALFAAVTRRNTNALHALIIGAIAGLLVITRENAMVWLPILGAWVWTNCRLSIVECEMRHEGKKARRDGENRGWVAIGHTSLVWGWCWGRWGCGMRR